MALTLNRPLRLMEVEKQVFVVNGTPADCVNLAVRKILPQLPDFLISGMNFGENLSEDIFFSGTVGGAFAGYLYDIPSMAVSLISDRNSYKDGRFDIDNGIKITQSILKKLIEFPYIKAVFNLNIPFAANGRIKITDLGFKRYQPDIIEKQDPRGRTYFWIGTGDPIYNGQNGSDIWAVQNGHISLSVIKFNLQIAQETEKVKEIFDENTLL